MSKDAQYLLSESFSTFHCNRSFKIRVFLEPIVNNDEFSTSTDVKENNCARRSPQLSDNILRPLDTFSFEKTVLLNFHDFDQYQDVAHDEIHSAFFASPALPQNYRLPFHGFSDLSEYSQVDQVLQHIPNDGYVGNAMLDWPRLWLFCTSARRKSYLLTK